MAQENKVMTPTLTDSELIEACNNWVKRLCETGGRAWTLSIPVNFNKDPDMLIIELGKRLKQRSIDHSEMSKGMFSEDDMYQVWREHYGDVYPDKFEAWLAEYKQNKQL